MYILVIIVILTCIFYYIYRRRRERLTVASNLVYTNPRPGQKLRDPMHLPATVYRVTNTILTAADVFSDKMDSLPLPPEINDKYTEWIDRGFLSPVKDQMLCGGCWAFATCASLADRITIATNGKWYAPYGLSEQILISCGGDMGMDFYQGCEGGIPQFAIAALSKQGVPADSKCLICGGGGGSSGGGGGGDGGGGGVVNPNNVNTCMSGGNVYAATNYTWWQTGCDGNTSCSLSPASTCPCAGIVTQMEAVEDKTHTPFNVKYKTVGQAHTYTSHGANNELHTVDLWPDIPQSVIDQNVIRMKKAIYYEGPFTIGYRVTQDFYTFWPTAAVNNYYKYDGRSPMAGGHAVVIVGWKKMEDGTPVWIIKNSWGANGGYGFPNGPQVVDPVTGETEIKYKGGFWNHIMGVNDSFVESNATGSHPDIHIPEIARYFQGGGKDIPEDWYEKMTVRDIQKLVVGGEPPSPPQPPSPPTPPQHEEQPQPQPPAPPQPPQPPTPPQPEFHPIDIKSPVFATATLTPENITPESIAEFFNNPNNYYMVGANTKDNVVEIMGMLPNQSSLNQEQVRQLVESVSDKITGYIVIAMRGDINNYYHLAGEPQDWKGVFNKTFANRAATMKKFVSDVYPKFLGLRVSAPIVQLGAKRESFAYRYI